MGKMAEDEAKLKVVQEEREAIRVKREIAANTALIERNRVAEMAKKALGGKNMDELLENGVDAEMLVNKMLGISVDSGGGEEKGQEKKGVKKKQKKIIVAQKQTQNNNITNTTNNSTILFKQTSTSMSMESTKTNTNTNTNTNTANTAYTTMNGNNSKSWGSRTPAKNPYEAVDDIRKRQNAELLGILTGE